MPEKIYVCLFILCAISYQGIVGAFLDQDIGELSNVLFREKRVISRYAEEDAGVATGVYPYVVNIRVNSRTIGVGTILSSRTVITTAKVMFFDSSQYIVTSGSTYSFNGINHNVTSKKILLTRPYRRDIGIALVFVHPPFLGRNTGSIGLHTGLILPGMHGTVIGWSCTVNGRQQTHSPRKLRAITVPIMSHRECLDIYRSTLMIREDDVCTYHEHKQCGDTDVGAPLVIDNELAGIHIGIIPTPNPLRIKPDIFVLLQHLNFNQWIRSNIIR